MRHAQTRVQSRILGSISLVLVVSGLGLPRIHAADTDARSAADAAIVSAQTNTINAVPTAPTSTSPKAPTSASTSVCSQFTQRAVSECSGDPIGSSKKDKVARLLTQIITFGASSAAGASTAESLGNACQSALPTVDAGGEANSEMGSSCLDAIESCSDQCRAEIENARKAGAQEQVQAATNMMKTCADQVENANKFFEQAEYYRQARKRITSCIAATGVNGEKPAAQAAAATTSTSNSQNTTYISTYYGTPAATGPPTGDASKSAGADAPIGGGASSGPDAGSRPGHGTGHAMSGPAATANGSGPNSRSTVPAYRFTASGQMIEMKSTATDARTPSQEKGSSGQAAFRSFPAELEDGGGGGGLRALTPFPPPAYPSFAIKKESSTRKPTRSTAEAAYCAKTAAAEEARICKSTHEALCADNQMGVPLEFHAEPMWDRLRLARRKFFDQNFIALQQVLGSQGPAGESPAQSEPAEKDRVVRAYSIQAAIDAEALARRQPPYPPDANQRLLDVFLLNVWNSVERMLPPAEDVEVAGESVRAAMLQAVARSEADSALKSQWLKQLNSVRLVTPAVKARPENDLDPEHLAAYIEHCGLMPLTTNAVYVHRSHRLFICPNIFQEGAATPPAWMLLAHEFGHALDTASFRDGKAYARYLSCQRAAPESPLASGHPRSHDRDAETIADFWMARTLAISTQPLFMTANTKLSTSFLRRTMSFLCRADAPANTPVDLLMQPPTSFRVGQVFGRDAWVRWQLGCANPCKENYVCTLQGSRADGEERPR
ncbi:MAG: hypothetical protein NDI61_05345 [Bdellovibrionaceae bacterium]|nr:hypothetical protein [Pseudobdellovibrionaceae bacterium]